MRKRTLISALIGLAALIGALLVARLVARQVQAQVISAPVVVARHVILPQTLITADLLTTREFPRAITSAPIYRDPQELVGLVARVEIVPDAPIFKSYAVSAQEARFSADAQAVAVALKLDTPRAVGGLIAPGQRVDVWRIAKAQPPRDLDAQTLLALRGAGVELVARDLRVLAVRASQGGQVAQPPPLGLAGGESEAAPTTSPASGTISVVTVKVSQDLAPALVRLMGELGNVYDLWLTLAPLIRDDKALELAPVYMPETSLVDKHALLLALTPSPTLTPSPQLEPRAGAADGKLMVGLAAFAPLSLGMGAVLEVVVFIALRLRGRRDAAIPGALWLYLGSALSAGVWRVLAAAGLTACR